ncbi:MAG: multidrug efflux SMR transporter [Methanobrevibacter sp.]|uniref:DMT family transporter n=1 Tax=Methanobrevibacter sp. TaxID=66852 RepID=UPI0026DFC315|nr:multidrug efflux SMR transporter [Methanobrevibacter sp.]MDO5849437.1 multidrug efflux SMR transporter [Methanobrevibacter sp.]
MNSWICLVIAGFFEMVWVLALKFSDNFKKIEYVVLTIVAMILSLLFLSFSFKSIPTGTAYACWTAIGAVGVIVVGMLFLGESTSFLRILFISLIVIGIVGLKLVS